MNRSGGVAGHVAVRKVKADDSEHERCDVTSLYPLLLPKDNYFGDSTTDCISNTIYSSLCFQCRKSVTGGC